jgi:hypothetical protein
MSAHTLLARILGAPIILALALLGSGCKEELGPERYLTARVSGVIKEGERPVSGGWIEFLPVNGTVGNQRSARIQPDGSFQADKVAVGENALRLVNARIQVPGGGQIFGAFTTPIRRRIPERPDGPLAIDLLEEAVRYQSALSRVADRTPQNPGAAP